MGTCFKYRTCVLRLAFSAGNSGYTDREEYEEENGRKNFVELPFTDVDPCGPVTGSPGGFRLRNYYKSSPL